eukprot:2009628-Amphidinium_carterae.1
MLGRRGTRSRLIEADEVEGEKDLGRSTFNEHLQANQAHVEDGEEPSSSDLEEAVFETRGTRSASVCRPFECTQGVGCTLPKTDDQGGTLNKRRVFGGPRVDSNGSACTVDRGTEIGAPGFTKDREAIMEHLGRT